VEYTPHIGDVICGGYSASQAISLKMESNIIKNLKEEERVKTLYI